MSWIPPIVCRDRGRSKNTTEEKGVRKIGIASSWVARRGVGQRGFTMVELLVVMGISLFGLAGLMSVYTTSSRANVSTGHSAEGIAVCEQTMEEFRAMSITDIEANPAYGGITAAGWTDRLHENGNVIGRNGVIFERLISAVQLPPSAGLVRLQVVVRWSENGTDPADSVASPPATIHKVSLEMIRTRVEAL